MFFFVLCDQQNTSYGTFMKIFSAAVCIVISAPELHIAELCPLRPKFSPE